MAINRDVYFQPARKSDVGRLAIRTSLALSHVTMALMALQSGDKEKLQEAVNALSEASADIAEHFNELSGWTTDDE